MNSREIRDVIISLRSMIEKIVDDKINALPITVPCKVVGRDGVTLSAVPLITFGTLTPTRIDGIPIMKSKYINDPIKDGDFGLLVPSSFFYSEIVTKDKTEIESAVATMSSGNYIFLPISQSGADFSDGIDTELWSKGGGKYLRMKEDKIELGGTAGFATEHTALSTAITNFLVLLNAHTHTSAAPGSPTTPPVAPMTLDISAAKVSSVTV